jgi:tagatose-6-phosphate ketose/aldose isomerase
MTGTSFMVKEISSQPQRWMETFQSIHNNRTELATFLSKIRNIENMQVKLTGAGSSAFIGEILHHAFHANTGLPVQAIPTTDLVTHPRHYFQKAIPTLLVSFARSGDSPESVAAFQLAEELVDDIFHLVITCSKEGKLASIAAAKKNAFVFLLPEETNDQALAMTSSFTSMTLAGLLISDINNLDANKTRVKKLSEFGEIILNKYTKALDKVADLDFKRIVFIGSGPLKGTAKESHLKVIELTDGEIVCQYDSFLGFRHGPKAIIDKTTLLVYIFSNDPYIHKYEADLVKSIDTTEDFIYSIGIGQNQKDLDNLKLDLSIRLSVDSEEIEDDFFSICSVLPAQILGFYKSQSLGLTPDSPSKNGGIHRIVQGVNIYPYNK